MLFRSPELARNAQILAAPHQCVGFAPLGRGGDAVGIEVLLLAAGDGNESTKGISMIVL